MSYILTNEDCDTIGDVHYWPSAAQSSAQQLANDTNSAVTIWKEYDTVEPDGVEDEVEDEELEVTEEDEKPDVQPIR